MEKKILERKGKRFSMNNGIKLEKLLNKKLPMEYKKFLDSQGLISENGKEVYGFSPNLDINKIPCVIGATNLYKKIYNLKDNELVVSFDELENSPILLNIEDGKIYSIDIQNNRKLLYGNFLEFLKMLKEE